MGCLASVPEAATFLQAQSRDPKGDMCAEISPADSPIQLQCQRWKCMTMLRGITSKAEEGYEKGKHKECLTVTGPGINLTVNMCPLDSFKKMTTITDSSGKLVAAMYTGSSQRPEWSCGGVYNIMGPTPRVQGQKPMMQSENGVPLYHWVTDNRPGYGNTQNMTVVEGAQYAVAQLIGDVRKMTITKQGAGVATSRKSPDGNQTVDIAAGVDPLLIVCMIYTHYLASNEMLGNTGG